MSTDKTPKIRVVIRKRPMSQKQLARGDKDIVEVQSGQSVTVREDKVKVDLTPFTDEYRFIFDGAYSEQSTNQQIYQSEVKPLVASAFDGARVACFAYGQTGSGKTHTMLGDGKSVYGLYLLAACDIFEHVSNSKMDVWVSFYEIYCGKLFDLLNDRSILVAREDAKNNVNIVGLSEMKITNVKNLMSAIQYGTNSRVTAQNGTNVDSSRSHAILQISLKQNKKTHGKISFIDLAGSQRAADHANQLQKQTRIDGAQINKSLLALKQCIRALDQNKSHTPFRGSKLTMVLKDSFTGYCRTLMIGNISPNSSSSQNTLNTLKYADRVKQLKKPIKDMNACEPVDGDNLDELDRGLMLPRQLINHRRMYKSGEKGQEFTPRKYSGGNVLVPQNKVKNNQSKSHGKNNNNSFEDGNNVKTAKKEKQNKKAYEQYRSQRTKTQKSMKNPQNLVQQKQPEPLTFQQISKKHSQIVGRLIKGQQQLVSAHEAHVNKTIQLAKQQMKLLSIIDDPENNFEDYLVSLDLLLQKQLESLLAVKNKVKHVMQDFNQSERMEKQFVQASYKKEQQQDREEKEDSLLEEDQVLFK